MPDDSACPTGCGHDLLLHMAHGCPMCDCQEPGPFIPMPVPDGNGQWNPPGTIGGQWVRLNRRTGLYEWWPDFPTTGGRDA